MFERSPPPSYSRPLAPTGVRERPAISFSGRAASSTFMDRPAVCSPAPTGRPTRSFREVSPSRPSYTRQASPSRVSPLSRPSIPSGRPFLDTAPPTSHLDRLSLSPPTRPPQSRPGLSRSPSPPPPRTSFARPPFLSPHARVSRPALPTTTFGRAPPLRLPSPAPMRPMRPMTVHPDDAQLSRRSLNVRSSRSLSLVDNC